MNGVSRHDSALVRLYGPGTTWANEMKFVMNHAPGAGSITWWDYLVHLVEKKKYTVTSLQRETTMHCILFIHLQTRPYYFIILFYYIYYFIYYIILTYNTYPI